MYETIMADGLVETWLKAPYVKDDVDGKRCEVTWHRYGAEGDEFVGLFYDEDFILFHRRDADYTFRPCEIQWMKPNDDGLYRITFRSGCSISALELRHPWLGTSVMYRRGREEPLPLGAYAPCDHTYDIYMCDAASSGTLFTNPVMVTQSLPECGALVDVVRKFRHVAGLARTEDDTMEVSYYLIEAIRPMVELLKRPSSAVAEPWSSGQLPRRVMTTGWLLEHQLQLLIDGRHLSSESLIDFGGKIVAEVDQLAASLMGYMNV